jgi:hypothetical protein
MFTAEEQKALVERAGFIDVQVFEKWIDFGKFSDGTPPKKAALIGRSDFETGREGRAVCSCLGFPPCRPAIHLDGTGRTTDVCGEGD